MALYRIVAGAHRGKDPKAESGERLFDAGETIELDPAEAAKFENKFVRAVEEVVEAAPTPAPTPSPTPAPTPTPTPTGTAKPGSGISK